MTDFRLLAKREMEMLAARERFEDAKYARYIYCADELKFLVDANCAPHLSVRGRLATLDSRVDEAREELRLAIKRYNQACES